MATEPRVAQTRWLPFLVPLSAAKDFIWITFLSAAKDFVWIMFLSSLLSVLVASIMVITILKIVNTCTSALVCCFYTNEPLSCFFLLPCTIAFFHPFDLSCFL